MGIEEKICDNDEILNMKNERFEKSGMMSSSPKQLYSNQDFTSQSHFSIGSIAMPFLKNIFNP